MLAGLLGLQAASADEKRPEFPDPDRDPKHRDTHFWRAVDGFLTALEKKEPEKFFKKAWALADKANKARFGNKVPNDPKLAFGARQITQRQRDSAEKAWKLIENTVDLDATFKGYREDKFSELGFTVEGLRGAMWMSKAFVLSVDAKIALGLKPENRGKYSYSAFRKDMIEEFGFGNDQTGETPVHQVARAGTRSRLKKALDAKLGEKKAADVLKVFNVYFVEVAGAAIFAHAEASMELASSRAESGARKAEGP